MEVETHEVTEMNEAGEIEVDEEAVKLIDELGLAGQKRLIEPEKEDADLSESRCPYRKMTSEEYFVFDNLFKSKTGLIEYDDESIPLRVLQIASHATRFFQHIEIWHKPSADVKDPLLVGVDWKDNDTWQKKYYTLARWGEALEAFPVLAQKAAQQILNSMKSEMKDKMSLMKSEAAVLENMSLDDVLVKQKNSIGSYYPNLF